MSKEDLDWVKYRKQSKEPKYGGNLASDSYSIEGMHGEYPLNEGYFICQNPYGNANGLQAMLNDLNKKLNGERLFEEGLRSIIFTGTIRHRASNLFINFLVLFE